MAIYGAPVEGAVALIVRDLRAGIAEILLTRLHHFHYKIRPAQPKGKLR